jgi:two-component system LytT family sensor kinase
MQADRFLYNSGTRHRLARHITLWVLYAIYFTLQSYYPTGISNIVSMHFVKSAILSTCLFLPFCIFSTYTYLYYLHPRFLLKKNFFLFTVNFFALLLVGTIINYFASTVFFTYSTNGVTSSSRTIFLGFHNVVVAFIISILALGLKLGKDAYLQQEANLELARQKARMELQLLKTRIDPRFLFNALDMIQAKIDNGSPDSPAAIIELSEILSEILYATDTDELK